MSGRSAIGLAIALGAVALAALSGIAGDTGSKRRAAYPAHFPDDPGKTIAERGCLICHSAMLVTQQRKDSTAWEKTILQMEAWGAPATPAERETLLVYLTKHFGPAPK